MGRRVQFVIAGDGNKLLDFQNIARGNTDIVFTGWVDAAVLHEIMRRSCAGLDPLLDRYDFLSTINNKAVEYLSAGIPVISSPARGTLFKFLKLNHCGLSYQYGDSKRLATIISALMDNPSELQAMSANAERAFQENFLPDDVNARMLSHLERVVKEFPINANHRK